jgi:hypothetical protein
MSNLLNQDLSGVAIADEVINRASAVALPLVYSTILDNGSLQVRTAPSGGGTLLTRGVDYDLADLDADLTAEAGVNVYLTLAVINGAQHGVDLYVSYKTIGDIIDAGTINEIMDDVTELFQGSLLIGGLTSRCEMPGVTLPSLPASLAACSGQLISDAASPFNGKRLPNLNGENVVLTLTFTATAGGATATVSEADRAAIALHDWVAGSGIAALTYVKSFNYSTGALVISDAAASGSIPTTFSNEGRSIVGGATFGSVGDAMQVITGELDVSVHRATDRTLLENASGAITLTRNLNRAVITNLSAGVALANAGMNFNSAASPNARTGTKTKADAYRMAYYMRIK